jgi:D-alanyl-D-alanine dipeptidase
VKLVACALVIACTADATPARSPVRSPIPDGAAELVTAIVDDWSSTTATLQLWHRDRGSGWQPVGEPWPAVIGAKGAAWGDGLHGHGAPSGQHGPIKHEGDQASPAGAFAFRAAYGYAAQAPQGTHLPYTPSDGLECVDDPSSSHYAQITRPARDGGDWKSAEHMKRGDALYTWVIDIAHNPDHIRGDGSCIFLHVWNGPGSTTVGCTAMDEAKLASLVATLEPTAVYVLLPRAVYHSLASAWNLPGDRLPP